MLTKNFGNKTYISNMKIIKTIFKFNMNKLLYLNDLIIYIF